MNAPEQLTQSGDVAQQMRDTLRNQREAFLREGVVSAETRIDRMQRALSEFEISGRGVKTTIPFHQRILANERFRSGDVSTRFVEQFMAEAEAAALAS